MDLSSTGKALSLADAYRKLKYQFIALEHATGFSSDNGWESVEGHFIMVKHIEAKGTTIEDPTGISHAYLLHDETRIDPKYCPFESFKALTLVNMKRQLDQWEAELKAI